MTIPVPTLSSSGWVFQLAEKTDKLLSYFFTSEASQSNTFRGRISSLPDIIKQYGHDDLEVRGNMQTALRDYLERYYDNVEIDVSTEIQSDLPDDNRINITVDVTVYQDGESYMLAHLIRVLNSSIQEIIRTNNDG